MPLPKKIQEQEDQANQLVADAAAAQNEGAPAQPAEQAPHQQAAEESNEAELYKQRYQSLKGMYESQVPQYQEQIKFLQEMLSRVRPDVTGDEPQERAASPSNNIFGKVEINEQEVEDYGQDFFDVVGRQAQLATQPGFAQMANQIEQLKETINQLTSGQASLSRNTFEAQLSDIIPNWRDIDTNPEFLNWLNTEDSFTGTTKFDLLRNAVSRGDANRAAVFFDTWSKSKAPAQAGVTQQAQQQPAPRPQNGMASIATPSVAQQPDTAAANMVAQGGKIYTQEDVATFYANVRKGLYNGREAEVSAIENDLQRALQEGRVAF